MEFHRRLAQETHCSPANSSSACAENLRPGRSCITARANGIRANRCRAGRSRRIGARTACRSGRTIRSSPTNRRITATARRRRRNLLSRIAKLVGGDPKHLIPAYEDAFYYTWKERRFPSNVTPEKSNLKDKQERERIARIFQQGLGSVVGYSAPHQARVRQRWLDDRPWFLARRRHALADPRRFADGPAPAAGFHSVGGGKRFSVAAATRPVESRTAGTAERISVSPASSSDVRAAGAYAARSRPRSARAKTCTEKIEEPVAPTRARVKARRGSSAPRCASSRATVACTSSCRRSRGPRITSTSSPASKPPSPRWACRSSSKARPRPKIRA